MSYLSSSGSEGRTVLCGLILHYSICDGKVTTLSTCRNTPENIALIKQREVCHEELLKYVAGMDVDRKFVDAVFSQVEYIDCDS